MVPLISQQLVRVPGTVLWYVCLAPYCGTVLYAWHRTVWHRTVPGTVLRVPGTVLAPYCVAPYCMRDHMNDFELIFTMLGERSTTEIHRNEDSRGVEKLKSDAKAGGAIAGTARRQLERRLGRSVVSKGNFLPERKSQKTLKGKQMLTI